MESVDADARMENEIPETLRTQEDASHRCCISKIELALLT